MKRSVPYGYWTDERIKKEAAKYETRKDFERNCASAYRQALRLKITETVFKHMKYQRNRPY